MRLADRYETADTGTLVRRGHHAAIPNDMSSARSLSNPLRMRVLVVPSGTRSALATSA